MIDYKTGIHPESGNIISCDNDIIVTPFFTKDFCNELVELSRFYKDRFNWDPSLDSYPNWELFLVDVSKFMFEDYIAHYKEKICPMLNSVFLKDEVWGFYSPFINRYTMDSQRTSNLHNDTSMISMVVKLNDDYTGGELEFPRQQRTNKDIPVGHAVVFPGSITHPHRVNELTSGVKYGFVSWTWPDNWKDPKGQLRNPPPKPRINQPKLV